MIGEWDDEQSFLRRNSLHFGLFHWGLVAWAIYCLPTLAIAYPYYNRGIPYLRISTACHEFLGKQGEKGLVGRLMEYQSVVNQTLVALDSLMAATMDGGSL